MQVLNLTGTSLEVIKIRFKKAIILIILTAIVLTAGCINNTEDSDEENQDIKNNKEYSSCLAEMKYEKMSNSEIKDITEIIESFSIDFDQSNLMFHFYHRENNEINYNYTIPGTIFNNDSTTISLQFSGTKRYDSDKQKLAYDVDFVINKLNKNLIEVKYSPQYSVV